MAKKKDKAVFIVLKYPYIHPNDDDMAPVGSEVDLSHLSIADRQRMVDLHRMEPTAPDALMVEGPESEPEDPKLNKYGLPFGQMPKKAQSKEK